MFWINADAFEWLNEENNDNSDDEQNAQKINEPAIHDEE